MRCVLMNKNTEILVAEYDTILNGFSEIYELKNINYAPLIIKKRSAAKIWATKHTTF